MLENEFENVVYEKEAIMSRPQCVNNIFHDGQQNLVKYHSPSKVMHWTLMGSLK